MEREIRVRQITVGTPAWRAAVVLRNHVLRYPLCLKLEAADLAVDQNAWHVGAFTGRRLVGILLLSPEGDGAMRMRQVVIEPSLQRQGIGRQMVCFAEELLRRRGIRRVTLHARQSAVGFYTTLGYRLSGEAFTEVGLPHLPMEKELD